MPAGAISTSMARRRACAVTVSMAGYQPYKAVLQNVCAAPAQGGCLTVELRVMLAPEPGKTPGATK